MPPARLLALLTAATLILPACTSTSRNPEDAGLLQGERTIVIVTSKGEITLVLDAESAPKTVTNFVQLAQRKFYDGQIFHRIIDGFMIQGGDPNGDGTGGESIYGSTFEDEINADSYRLGEHKLKDVVGDQPLPAGLEEASLKSYYEAQGYVYRSDVTSLPMERGAIAMANRGPNTNASQFFLLQVERAPWLEGRHTVFGRVTQGMEVVDAIAKVKTNAMGRPAEPITFTVRVLE